MKSSINYFISFDLGTNLHHEKTYLTKFHNLTISMALNGWNNIHNKPIGCATITTAEGAVYITDTIDTSGNSHTTQYLAGITKTAIQLTELKSGCKAGSFVTDNVANM